MSDKEHRMVVEQPEDSTADLEFVYAAAEAGYFDVPRETPLGDLAEQADISNVEATERIRRGVKELIARTPERE